MTARVVLFGCGRVVQEAYLPTLRRLADELQVVGAYDPDAARARSAVAALGQQAPAGSDLERLRVQIGSEVDLVILATPPESALAALTLLPWTATTCLVEKPFLLHEDALAAARDLARTRRLRVEVVNNYQWRPDVVAVRALIASGAIGRLRWGRLHMLASAPWEALPGGTPWRTRPGRNSTGVVGDKAYHLIYLAEALGGEHLEFTSVTGAPDDEVPDCWSAAGRTGDCLWSLFTGWNDMSGGVGDVLEINGDNGKAVLDPALGGSIHLYGTGRDRKVPYDSTDGWGYEALLRAVLRGSAGNDLSEHSRRARLLT